MNKLIKLCLLPLVAGSSFAAFSYENSNQIESPLSEILPSYYPRVERFIPDYSPSYWNTNNSHQTYNNCYNYAGNRISPTRAKSQPGYAKGHRGFNSDRGASCAGVIAGAKADGFVEVPRHLWASKKASRSSYKTLMALVLAPYYDYHWYRRDSNGKWSHKPGSTAATNLDNSNNQITDPETANRGVYRTFCGYFENMNYYYMPHYIPYYSKQNRGNIYVTGTFRSTSSTTEGEQPQYEKTTSTVSILKYSGRENPVMPLSQLDDYLQFRVAEIANLQDSSIIRKSVSKPGENLVPSKLGYAGIYINDTQGLYFNKGDQVLITEEGVRVLSDTAKGKHAKSNTQFTISPLLDLSLEQDLINFIESNN